MTHSSHALVRAHGAPIAIDTAQAWCSQLPLAIERIDLFHAKDQALSYLRIYPAANATPATPEQRAEWLSQCEQAAQALPAELLELSWLENTLVRPGASHVDNASVPWHYVVETDVTPEAEDDFNQWYDTEHLPGLAAVTGVQLAQRFVSAERSPRYHASYDLHTVETFGSPAWLLVRATPWSDRVRPEFRRTRRTMLQHIASLTP